METISNSCLAIAVDPLGAELKSLRTVDNGLEYLWQGDDKYWGGQSPVLFPIIGGLPDNRYCYQDRLYEMFSHGFARDSLFTVMAREPDKLDFSLSHSDATRRQYPFQFALSVSFQLQGNLLRQEYSVRNLDEKAMLFSIGAHPGFRCPLYPGELMEDYYLVFEQKENLRRRIKQGSLLSGQTMPFLDDSNFQPLSHELFYPGAVILDQVRSNWLEIRNRKNPHIIRVDFAGFPYLGIWSAVNDAPFVCIEPWYGVDSAQGDSPELTCKEGLQVLNAGDSFSCSFGIKIE